MDGNEINKDSLCFNGWPYSYGNHSDRMDSPSGLKKCHCSWLHLELDGKGYMFVEDNTYFESLDKEKSKQY